MGVVWKGRFGDRIAHCLARQKDAFLSGVCITDSLFPASKLGNQTSYVLTKHSGRTFMG